jgi:hypothetical protein
MNSARHWKIILALAGLITGSGLAGGLIGHGIARNQFETQSDPASWNEHVSREFDRIVKPTPEQGTKIQKHLDQAVRELQTIRLETIGRSTNVIWHLVAEVEQELTPDQRKAFEAMKPQPADLTLDILKVKPPSAESR